MSDARTCLLHDRCALSPAQALAADACLVLNRRGLTLGHVKRAAAAVRALPPDSPDDQWTWEERVAIAVLEAALAL